MAGAEAATSLMDLDPVADEASAADPAAVSAGADSSESFDMFAQQEQQEAAAPAAGATTAADCAPPFKARVGARRAQLP